MTIIAYRDGIMASDSAVTDHNYYVGQSQKIRRILTKDDNVEFLVGVAGPIGTCREMLDWFSSRVACDEDPEKIMSEGRPKIYPEIEVNEACMIVVVGLNHGEGRWSDQIWHYDSHRYSQEVSGIDFTVEGSGRFFALGAMANGASAIQAVGLSCTYVGGIKEPVVDRRFTWLPEDIQV